MRQRLVGFGLIAGTGWGAFAWLLGHRALGTAIWGGVLAGPLIGVAIATTTHRRFVASDGWPRRLWALVTVYFGAVSFALAAGLLQLARGAGGRAPLETIAEPLITVLWGVTMTGYLLFLWPLAYATHWWLEHRFESSPG